MLDSSCKPCDASRYQGGEILPTSEYLAVERPLDIRLNGESLAITLCSPGADRALALGLLFSEGRISAAEEVLSWETGETEGSDLTGPIPHQAATLAKSPGSNGSGSTRVLTMNSACGLCGKTEWENPPDPPVPAAARSAHMRWAIGDLPRFFAAMSEAQGAFARTGGCHAAAAFSAQGKLLSVHEDVGRHNAVDKVVGDLLERNLIGARADKGDVDWPALLCVSGRVAFEIVAKAHRGGFAALAAVGAPSDLSVRHAHSWGLTLLGFCREGRATAYAHGDKLGATAERPAPSDSASLSLESSLTHSLTQNAIGTHG
ncbi:MAG: formate dehydrogenase accessory sulfurtransferase FdhD [Fibrobacteria bacterium]